MGFHHDHRVRGRDAASRRGEFDEARGVLRIELPDPEDDAAYEAVEIPAAFGVCGTCDGRGTHVNPAIDCDGISAEDFAEDPDFERDYRRGAYDVPCYECGGLRVVPVPDRESCAPGLLKRYEAHLADLAAMDAEFRAAAELGF